LHLRLLLEGDATAIDGARDGAQQHVVAEGLGQELDRPAFMARTVIGTSPCR
jgi:hypothetical protein